MRRPIIIAIAAAVAIATSAASPRGSLDMPGMNDMFGQTRRAVPYSACSNSILKKSPLKRQSARAIAPEANTGPSTQCEYMTAPDGSTWYATGQTDTDEFGSICHYKFTVYDSNLNPIGSIESDIAPDESLGETSVREVQINPWITKKFFNFDDKYEVMVYVCVSNSDYEIIDKTVVFSLGNNTPLATFNGNCISAIDASTDSWSENFYLTFMDYTNDDINFHIYSKAGYGTGAQELKMLTIPFDNLAGEDAVPFMAKVVNGTPYFCLNYLEKPFYESNDWSNPNISPDNKLNILLYAYEGVYPKTFNLKCTTSIDCENPATTNEPFRMYYLGEFSYTDDITFGVYNSSAEPCYIITRANYVPASDSSVYDYYVYNAEGENIGTIGERVDGGIFMQDLPGIAPQVMFAIYDEDTELYHFDFVNYTELRTAHSLPQVIGDQALSTELDRIAKGDSYLYVSSSVFADVDNDNNAIHNIVYVNPDGTLNHVDRINLGQNVAMAQPYINGSVINPYTFDTDDEYEYAFLIKRHIAAGQSATIEELSIISSESKEMFNLKPDPEKGDLAHIGFVKNPEGRKMWIVWNKGWVYTTDLYNLPLESFTNGGDGTIDNPYIISTIADLQQVGVHPAANYRIANDIDAENFEFNSIKSFEGTIDGNYHVINNLTVRNSGLFEDITDAKISNIVIKDATLSAPGNGPVSLIAGYMVNSNIENIYVEGLKFTAPTDGSEYEVSGIAGTLALGSTVTGCSISDAQITAPSAQVGGIVFKTLTGSRVESCSFSGSIEGGHGIGGIVASFENANDVISNCHVNATLKGRSTIGGIAGTSARGTITNCYVEGSITATGPAQWTWDMSGAKAGGIVGELNTDYTQTPGNPIISKNVVNLESLEGFVPEGDEALKTTHRIVGWSAADDEPNYETGKPFAETGIADNYSSTVLPAWGSENINGVDGKTIEPSELTRSFFEGLDFAFGKTTAEPWQMTETDNLVLWFEIETPQSGIESVSTPAAADTSIISFDGTCVIAENQNIDIYTLSGINVAKGFGTLNVSTLSRGIYIAVAAGKALKIAVRN